MTEKILSMKSTLKTNNTLKFSLAAWILYYFKNVSYIADILKLVYSMEMLKRVSGFILKSML